MIKTACKEIDAKLVEDYKTTKDESGAVMVAVLRIEDFLYIFNVGDSRIIGADHLPCLLTRSSDRTNKKLKHEVKQITFDHCANAEKKRILKAGGWLDKGRVFGVLEPSRAFGYVEFKQQENKSVKEMLQNPGKGKQNASAKKKKTAVKNVRNFMQRTSKFPFGVIISVPDIHRVQVNDRLHFLIIASDGLWDVIANKRAVAFVEERLPETVDEKALEKICEELAAEAQKEGSKDDITVMVIVFE